ncbi:MAG: hypothetical protein AAF583_15730 [Pseudomonadota bacterium]
MRRINGAADGRDLEPSELVCVLESLEEWGAVLKGEPEVIHRLAAFAEAAEGGDRALEPHHDEPLPYTPNTGPEPGP